MLHVTFSPSQCGSLTRLLEHVGRAERVIFLPDDLSIGPLGLSTSDRVRAIEDMLSLDLDGLVEELDEFWNEVDASPAITVWTSRRVALERAGWLEIASRREGALSYIDAIDFEPEVIECFAVTPEPILLDLRVVERTSILDNVTRMRLRDVWARLREEDESLRIVEGDELRSAHITYFDESLLAHASVDWKPLILVVANLMAHAADDKTLPQLHNDAFGVARMIDLIDRGVLELDETQSEDVDIRRRCVRLKS